MFMWFIKLLFILMVIPKICSGDTIINKGTNPDDRTIIRNAQFNYTAPVIKTVFSGLFVVPSNFFGIHIKAYPQSDLANEPISAAPTYGYNAYRIWNYRPPSAAFDYIQPPALQNDTNSFTGLVGTTTPAILVRVSNFSGSTRPAVGDVYSNNGLNFTVTINSNVSTTTKVGNMFGNGTAPYTYNSSGTFTKVSGSGPTTFDYVYTAGTNDQAWALLDEQVLLQYATGSKLMYTYMGTPYFARTTDGTELGGGTPPGANSPAYDYASFTVSGVTVNPAIGDTYTNNGNTYTVTRVQITAGSGTLTCDGTTLPSNSGTLTRATGSGDATISFSAYDNYPSIRNFITHLLQRYNQVSSVNPSGNKMISYIDEWNEPKFVAGATYFTGTGAQLAAMSRAVYQAAKAVDSSVQMVSPGFTPGGTTSATAVTQYVDQFLQASDGAGFNGAHWIDVLAFHDYAITISSDWPLLGSATTQTFYNVTALYADLAASLVTAGNPGLPIIISEYGINSSATSSIFATYSNLKISQWTFQSEIYHMLAGFARVFPYSHNSIYIGTPATSVNASTALNSAYLLNGKTIDLVTTTNVTTMTVHCTDGTTIIF